MQCAVTTIWGISGRIAPRDTRLRRLPSDIDLEPYPALGRAAVARRVTAHDLDARLGRDIAPGPAQLGPGERVAELKIKVEDDLDIYASFPDRARLTASTIVARSSSATSNSRLESPP